MASTFSILAIWGTESCGFFESHHRCAGYNAQIVHPGEAVDERVGHPVTQVFLGWISREVL